MTLKVLRWNKIVCYLNRESREVVAKGAGTTTSLLRETRPGAGMGERSETKPA